MRLTKSFLGKSLAALLDQGLFAISNFLLNISLARWLPPENYGAFALAFTIFLFVGVIHSSVFSEPMLVFGSGRLAIAQGPYLKSLIRLHWTKGWPSAAFLICIGAFAYWDNEAFSAIILLSLVCGSMLYQWLIRRACYLCSQPMLAATGGAIYLAIVLAGVVLLRTIGHLGCLQALTVMGIASGGSGAIIHFLLLRQGALTTSPAPADSELLRMHWEYGRWSIATGVVGWLAGNVAMLCLPWWHGNAAAATFRAGMNLILPVQQLLAAAGPLLLPLLVRSRERKDYPRLVLRYAAAFTVGPVVWAVMLTFGGHLLASLFYGDRYIFDRSFLILLGSTAAVSSFGLVAATAIRALELPRLSFYGYAASGCTSVILGVPLIWKYGLSGAVWSLAVASVMSASVLIMIFLRHSTFAADSLQASGPPT